jgi:hypothetical protein
MFFVREGDRWLIDGIYEKVASTQPGAYPTLAADLRATPAGGTQGPTPEA